MPNPHMKFEVEIGVIGVWFTKLDSHGAVIPKCCMFISHNDLASQDINWLTKELQIHFNF